MIIRILLVTILLGLGISTNAQVNVYVDSSVTASGSGGSWSTAYKTLGEALNATRYTSWPTQVVISVAKGTYYPGGDASNTKRDTSFWISRGALTVNGGYPSGGGVRDIAANPTILSGDIGAAGNSDNIYHIMVVAHVFSSIYNVVLSGLEFRDAHANGTGSRVYGLGSLYHNLGGGLAVLDVASNCIVSECGFFDNQAVVKGGAAYVDDGQIIFNHCRFEDNAVYGTTSSAGYGGALSIRNTNMPIKILNCAFRRSSSTLSGGAVSAYTGGINTIDSCEFTSNYAGEKGGGIFSVQSSGTTNLSNSTFTSNTAAGKTNLGAGGAFCGFSTLVRRCRFEDNFAEHEAGAVSAGGQIIGSTFDGNKTNGNGGAGRFYRVDSCLFTNNKAGGSGGAVVMNNYCYLTDCQFFADTAGNGGGAVFCDYPATIVRCTIGKNVASYGGGIYTSLKWILVRNSVISGNTATVNGGGFYSKNIDFVANSCLFSGNKAVGNGGAIYDSSANPSISNCTFAADSATDGNGIYNTNSQPVLENCIVWEGATGIFNTNSSAPNVTYSIVEGGYSGVGNSSANPLFINPLPASAIPDTGGVFNIPRCSPAVDAGNNSGSYSGVFDLAGNARLSGTNVDCGAFEFPLPPATPISGRSTVCATDTIQLRIGASGGTWSSSNPANVTVDANGLVQGLNPGTETITYSVPVGNCASLTTKTITVNPRPAIAAITGKTVICQNDTIHLSNSVAGGSWYNAQPTIGTLKNIKEFKGLAGGTDTVFYTTTNSFGCRDTARTVITVNALPTVAPIVGPANICDGDIVTFSNATSGGTWSNFGGLIYTLSSSGIATTLKPGTDSVRYTFTSSAGCSSYVQKTFTVNSMPMVAISSYVANICWNTNPVFTASMSGGVWRSDDPAVATIDASGTVSPVSEGTVRITYTYTNASGCSATAEKYVSVTQVDTQVIVSGNVLRANQNNAYYQWLDCDLGDMPIAGATGRTFTATKNGHYAVDIKFNGCVERSGCFTVSGVGIQGSNRNNKALTVVPNPVSTLAMIRLQTPGSYVFSLRDPSGKVLRQQKFSGSELNIDLSDFASGVYFIEMISGTERLSQKLQILR